MGFSEPVFFLYVSFLIDGLLVPGAGLIRQADNNSQKPVPSEQQCAFVSMKPFKEAFCEHYGCKPEDYMRKVFFFCAIHKNKTLVTIAWWFETPAVEESMKVIQDVANAKTVREVEDAFFDYRHDLHDRGLANSKFRISTNALVEVFKIVQGMEVL